MLVFGLGTAASAAELSCTKARQVASSAVLPAMAKHQIPGMSVAVVSGAKTCVFHYGVSALAGQRPVTNATMFEIGSISKTFTAALATYAQALGKLQLTDTVAKHMPELAGSDFGNLQLVHLGTHTTGGMPLQVPEELQNQEQLLAYLRAWKPSYETGTMRTYANLSIGVLGWIAARSLGQDFDTAVDQHLFKPLRLNSTYLRVPTDRMKAYAWGYNKDNKAVRVNPGLLDSEAYGIKTTATDLAVFLQANMGLLPLDKSLQTALQHTRMGYFHVGQMTQGLIWETYAMPVDVQTLRDGNASSLVLNPTPVSARAPTDAPKRNEWVNKTGATNGFGAYVAFVPAERFGIVLLANRNYPNADRVDMAHQIYSGLQR